MEIVPTGILVTNDNLDWWITNTVEAFWCLLIQHITYARSPNSGTTVDTILFKARLNPEYNKFVQHYVTTSVIEAVVLKTRACKSYV